MNSKFIICSLVLLGGCVTQTPYKSVPAEVVYAENCGSTDLPDLADPLPGVAEPMTVNEQRLAALKHAELAAKKAAERVDLAQRRAMAEKRAEAARAVAERAALRTLRASEMRRISASIPIKAREGGGARNPVSRQLVAGALAWNTPAKMQLTRSAQVELRVSMDSSKGAELAKRITAPGETTVAIADLSETVVATLDSTKFDISPPGPQRQLLLPDRDTEWRWVISPKTGGTQTLNLRVESILHRTGSADEVRIQSLSRTIEVDVDRLASSINFLEKNWKELLTVVLIPVVGGAIQIMRRRRIAARETPLPPIG